MAMITPDFSEESKPIEPGRYTVRVAGHAPKVSKQTQARYIAWTLEIIDAKNLGGKLSFNTMLEGRGAGILKHFLKACDGVYDGAAFDPDHYIGSRIFADVIHEEYNGKMQVKVKDVSTSEPAFSTEDIPF